MQNQTTPKRYAEVDISGKVRAVAAEYRSSQSQLADALHMSRMAITRRMSGDVQWSARDIAVLADHFGVSIARFYGDAA